MEISFAHPTTSDIFIANCEPECTGKMAIDGLIQSKFLDAPARGSFDLVLARTQLPLPGDATLKSIGVQPGDMINVFRRGAGASDGAIEEELQCPS